nr:MAG TPA: hypothetical protein [Caudoviricetes sp.]
MLGTWKRREGRCRAAAGSSSARCLGRPVRAAPLRNTQYESISSVSSRRDPGAPRLQNPHPPLRFRFAQPRSTQYFVLGTQIRLRRIFNCSLLTAFGVLRTQCSLRSHAARRLRRLAPSTRYYVPSTECLDSFCALKTAKDRFAALVCAH